MTSEQVAQLQPTRQELLFLWLKRNGMTFTSIGKELGVHKQNVGKWVKAERISTWRYNQLREMGIPEDLLPRAENITGGRWSKDRSSQSQSVTE